MPSAVVKIRTADLPAMERKKYRALLLGSTQSFQKRTGRRHSAAMAFAYSMHGNKKPFPAQMAPEQGGVEVRGAKVKMRRENTRETREFDYTGGMTCRRESAGANCRFQCHELIKLTSATP